MSKGFYSLAQIPINPISIKRHLGIKIIISLTNPISRQTHTPVELASVIAKVAHN